MYLSTKFVVTSMIIGMFAIMVATNPNIWLFGQASEETQKKEIQFRTFVINLDHDGNLVKFNNYSDAISGTNDELIKKYPDVIKAFYSRTNNTKNVTTVNIDPTNGTAKIEPKAKSLQSYIDEFKDSLKQMDTQGEKISKRCWMIITDGEEDRVHVHRCW